MDKQKNLVTHLANERNASSSFTTNFTYYSYGRLSTRTHLSRIVETVNYNSNGYLSSISAGGTTRYTITSMNARQQLTGSTYGSNLNATFGFDSYGYPASTQTGTVQDYRYAFDASTGNLSSRQNYLRNKSESFGYDNLDRLTSVTGPQNLTMTFNDNGNISTKSDIGTTAFGYGNNAGPYAMTSVESSTSVIPAVVQNATYNSYQKVNSIDEGDYSAAFIYNADRQRAKMDITQSGTNILTCWYAGGSYMKETASGVTKEYTYLGGDAYSAPVVAVTQSGTTNYYYLLRDHLGNITHQVNTSNNVVAEYSFDAWGRRRNPSDWSYDLTSQPELFAGRGFTSHEHLPWFNLVNMNGRLYDPLVGRFLSVDNVVQYPAFTQSYNRYSYCWNNPLKYADPDGNKLYIKDVERGPSACLDWGDSFNPCGGGGLPLKWGDVGIPGLMADNSMFGALDAISNSALGGSWSSESGTTIFNSVKDAEQAVINYHNENNSWGAYTSFIIMQGLNDALINNNEAESITNHSNNSSSNSSTDYYETASLEGGGRINVSQAAYQEAKDNFLGNKDYTGKCSNFVYDVYHNINHSLGDILRLACCTQDYRTLVETSNPVLGDIVQYLKTDGALFDHNAIYSGNNSMITPSSSLGRITIQLFKDFNPNVLPHFYHYVGD